MKRFALLPAVLLFALFLSTLLYIHLKPYAPVRPAPTPRHHLAVGDVLPQNMGCSYNWGNPYSVSGYCSLPDDVTSVSIENGVISSISQYFPASDAPLAGDLMAAWGLPIGGIYYSHLAADVYWPDVMAETAGSDNSPKARVYLIVWGHYYKSAKAWRGFVYDR